MKSLNRNTLAIYVATLFSYQMYIASSLLASVQAWFPTVNSNLIVLFFSAPLLANAFMALALSPAIGRINKKLLVVIGLATIIAGGTLVVLLGGNSFAIMVQVFYEQLFLDAEKYRIIQQALAERLYRELHGDSK